MKIVSLAVIFCKCAREEGIRGLFPATGSRGSQRWSNPHSFLAIYTDMPANFELQITKVQGIAADLSIVGCYVSLDGRLYDVITPLKTQSADSIVLLPSSGQLRLMIKKMSSGDDQVIGSVSFAIGLFPAVGGLFWVPLSGSSHEDAITAFGAETQGPRLLLRVAMPRMLPPVHETTETSIEESSLEQFAQTREEESNTSKAIFGDMSPVETSKDPAAKDEKQLFDLKQQVEALQQMLRLEKSQREAQETKLKTVFAEYEAAQKRMMTREKSLTSHLLDKDKELFRCIEENTELKIAARQTESEMYQLQEKVKLIEAQSASAALVSTSEALEFALEQLRESEQRRKELQSQVLSSVEFMQPAEEEIAAQMDDLKAQMAALQAENSELRAKEVRSGREIQMLREQIQHQQDTGSVRASLQSSPDVKLDVEVVESFPSRPSPSSLIDHLLSEFCEERHISNPFQKTGENVYVLEGKRYSLAVRSGALVAKVGAGFVYLEELVKAGSPARPKGTFTWAAPRLLSAGRSTSAGRERSGEEGREAGVKGHRKGESEVPGSQTARPQSPKKPTSSASKPAKTSTTPLKERLPAQTPKKAGIFPVDKSKRPFK